jgi:hypothetical protein
VAIHFAMRVTIQRRSWAASESIEVRPVTAHHGAAS